MACLVRGRALVPLLFAASVAYAPHLAQIGFAEEAPPSSPAPPPPAAPAPAVSVPTYENVACPITGRPAGLALFIDTDRGRVYFCSKGCIEKAKADPDGAYIAAYRVTQLARNRVCPVTGKPVGDTSPTVVLQGREIAVFDADAIPRAQANSQIVLALANRPGTTDVRNTVCPVTGGPVADNAFCIVGSELIHLSSPSAVDEVKKDPAKALAAAKDPPAAKPKPEERPKPGEKPKKDPKPRK